jgi:hypothetical protein
MLQINTGTLSVKEISGRSLARRLKKGLGPTHSALLCFAMEHGEVLLRDLTRRQAMALTRASAGYVATVGRLTPQERDLLALGKLSLSAVHNRPPTDADVDRVVAKLGAERARAALARLTKPAAPLGRMPEVNSRQQSFAFADRHVAAAK